MGYGHRRRVVARHRVGERYPWVVEIDGRLIERFSGQVQARAWAEKARGWLDLGEVVYGSEGTIRGPFKLSDRQRSNPYIDLREANRARYSTGDREKPGI